MIIDNSILVDSLIRNLQENKFSYPSHMAVNVYLTSFNMWGAPMEVKVNAAQDIENCDKDERLLSAIDRWSDGRVIKPKIMTSVSDDGLIDVNLLFITK